MNIEDRETAGRARNAEVDNASSTFPRLEGPWPETGVLRPGGRVSARLRIVEFEGQPAVLKDYGASPALFRSVVGRLMTQREIAAYRRLRGVEGIPRLIGRVGRDGLLLESLDGRNCLEAGDADLPASFFTGLRSILAQLRARGVLHGDVRNNVVVTPECEPRLVDFGASFVISGVMLPFRKTVVRIAEGYNERAVLKLKRSIAPGLLTASEVRFLARPLPFERWVRIGERIVKAVVRATCRLFERVRQDRGPWQ